MLVISRLTVSVYYPLTVSDEFNSWKVSYWKYFMRCQLLQGKYQSRFKHVQGKGKMVSSRGKDIYLELAQNISLSPFLSHSRFLGNTSLLLLSTSHALFSLLLHQIFFFPLASELILLSLNFLSLRKLGFCLVTIFLLSRMDPRS
jgi:hypothetical protein